MTTSQTTNLHLTKAVKGTAEPFSIDAVNANLDTIDSKVGAVGNTDLQSQVTSLGESVSIALSKGSKVEHGKATLVVNNGICRVSGYVNNDSTNIGSGDTLFDGIPAEYRPSSLVEIPMAISTSSGVFLAYYGYVVSNNGRIIQNATATARNVFFYGEWLV